MRTEKEHAVSAEVIADIVAALMVVLMWEGITNYHIKMGPGRITVDLGLTDSARPIFTIKQIIDQVALYYKVEATSITGRDRRAAMPRRVAIYLIRRLTNHSLDEIAKALGRTRSAVLLALRNTESDIKKGDGKLNTAVTEITKQLNANYKERSDIHEKHHP